MLSKSRVVLVWFVGKHFSNTIHLPLCAVLRFEHGGFGGGGGGGGGNSRWVEESRDEGDWSKPTPRNERLEQ